MKLLINENNNWQQQPLRLVYPNQTQLQNYSSFGTLINNAVQASHHTIPSQINQVPYQLQSSTSALNFPTNQSNIQNSNGFNQLMQSPSITHTYGAPLQVLYHSIEFRAHICLKQLKDNV